LRKWKVPSSIADRYLTVGNFGVLVGARLVHETVTGGALRVHIDQWGCVFGGTLDWPLSIFQDFMPAPVGGGLFGIEAKNVAFTDLDEFQNDVIDGDRGLLRRLPGYFPSGGPYGFATRLSKPTRNTRVEFYRYPRSVSHEGDKFELPENYIPVLRHYALYKAYSRRGVGQQLQLAQHYKDRYDIGVARAKARIASIHAAKTFRMGGNGGGQARGRRPYPVLPRNFTG
jgi:hypothetical protein